MNPVLGWTLVVILGLSIILMVAYGIAWLVANIQLYFIDKESKNFAIVCGCIYICMNSKQREFIDSNLKDIEIGICQAESEFDSMTSQEKNDKIMSLFEELKFYYDKYQKKVSKSCIFTKLMIGDEFTYYSDIFDTFSRAIKIS